MSNVEQDNAISFYVEEIEKAEQNEINIDELMAEIENEIENTDLDDELTVPQMINYHENFTIKELLTICEYYGFAKDLKNNKYNKEQIIDFLVFFESDIRNSDIVFKRQNMWFYINELKNDKFMKKFVLW
jgi:hypothetical protein